MLLASLISSKVPQVWHQINNESSVVIVISHLGTNSRSMHKNISIKSKESLLTKTTKLLEYT